VTSATNAPSAFSRPNTPDLQQQYSLEDTTGVVVTGITPDSPADGSGLRTGDVITEVNRKPVRNAEQYQAAVTAAHDQRHLLLLVHRAGQSFFVALDRAE
jgi:serine protease Do